MRTNFAIWGTYWGELLRDEDPIVPSVIYGFENVSSENRKQPSNVCVPPIGACYGYVHTGAVKLGEGIVRSGCFFSTPNGACLELVGEVQVLLLQAIGFLGLSVQGGPIEARGRLKYIDNCSDALLIAPPLCGDPCLNHLHFPRGVRQTEHTHPSTRAGIVARGQGVCVTPEAVLPLEAGRLFYIPRNGPHFFTTEQDTTMDVVAYHPDSDFGPTHEEHPMVNRTWVDGTKVDIDRKIDDAEVIIGRGGVVGNHRL